MMKKKRTKIKEDAVERRERLLIFGGFGAIREKVVSNKKKYNRKKDRNCDPSYFIVAFFSEFFKS